MGTRAKTSTKNNEHPGHFIREWRASKKMTLEALASRVESAVSSISQLERGQQGYSQATLEKLALALGTKPYFLLMMNPLEEDPIWAIQERLSKATPARRREILMVVDVMLNTQTKGVA
jgi:transcriptional regulator with XRE-family HTH domain